MVTIGKENFKINLAVIGAYSDAGAPASNRGADLNVQFSHLYVATLTTAISLWASPSDQCLFVVETKEYTKKTI